MFKVWLDTSAVVHKQAAEVRRRGWTLLHFEKGISILIAMHDLNMALDLGDRFFFLKNGRLLASGDSNSFNEENVRDTFGVDVTVSSSGGDKHIHFHHNGEHK